MRTTSSVLSNFLPVLNYPTTLKRIRMDGPMPYQDLNACLRFARMIHYHIYGNHLYFAGASETVQALLKANGMLFQPEEPLQIVLKDHLEILRVILYKAFRFFAQRKGFAWKPHKQTTLFATNILNRDKERIKNQFAFEFVHMLRGNERTWVYVHEGFAFKLEQIGQQLSMVFLPKVTPLLGILPEQLHPRMDLAPACHKQDCEVRASCRLAQKKITVIRFDVTMEKPWWCPYAERTLLVTDISDKVYQVPAHTLHLETNSHIIRRVGVYKQFRYVSMKNNWGKTQALRAILSYLADGGSPIRVPLGDDPEGFQIDAELKPVEVEEEPDAWKGSAVA